jgi:hypothetical protein
MIISIKIQPQMDCAYICQKVQEAISKYQKDNLDMTDTMILIDIKKPSDDTDLIPKLEFKIEDT